MTGEQQFGRIAPAEKAFALPNDTDFAPTRGVYVGATGNLRVMTAARDVITFIDIQAGVIHPLRIIRVYAVATTATGLIGLR